MAELSPRERALTEQLDEANETIRQLRLTLVPERPVVRYLGVTLSKTEGAVLGYLATGDLRLRCALEACIGSVNGHRDAVHEKNLSVVICRLRKRLPPGVTIETHHGEGFSMSAASIANLKALALPN